MAANIPITVLTKHVPWIEDLACEGPDYTAGTFRMEIRQKPGDTTAALVTLTNAAAGVQGISATYDPAYIDPETSEVFAATVFVFHITEATMEGLAAASPTNADVVLHYDVHVTFGAKFLLIYGSFTYSPGVTL